MVTMVTFGNLVINGDCVLGEHVEMSVYFHEVSHQCVYHCIYVHNEGVFVHVRVESCGEWRVCGVCVQTTCMYMYCGCVCSCMW